MLPLDNISLIYVYKNSTIHKFCRKFTDLISYDVDFNVRQKCPPL